MSVIKTEPIFLTMPPSDSLMEFPNKEPSIQNQPILINIKKETFHSDDEFYSPINPYMFNTYQTDNLMNIKTEPGSSQSMEYNSTEIVSQSKISDAEDSIKFILNQQSSLIIKDELIDIKVESHNTSDSSVMISALETSLISIKDEDYRKIQIFEDSSLDEDIAGPRNAFCDICDKDLASPKSLKRHCSEVHPGNKNYICDMCNKSFKHQCNLKRHKQTIHLNIRNWKCAHCEKSFGTKNDFTRHEKTVHLKIRDWKCSYCEETFGLKCHLKSHERIVHLKIRDWKCNHCNKSFTTKSNLKSHSRIHLSDCSELCDICNKSFRNLQRHKYHVHSKPKKNFKCHHCDKAFYLKKDLNRHVVIHSDARDWKCKICEKKFKLKVYLQKHEKIHLTNGPYI